MAAVDYTKLKKLREETGVSFSLCKKALEESSNDIEKAKKLLSEWGASKAAEKAGKSTSESSIFSYVHHNRKVAAMVEIQCETDFVSGNEDFKKLGSEIAMQVASVPAKNPKELLEQEYIRDPSKKIKDILKENILKFGENIQIARFERWAV